MDIYNLSRTWFNFCFENPEKINPTHTAIYFFAIEHCNRLGWKEKFGFPTTMVKEALGISSYNTYKKHLDDLVEFGFIKMVEVSRNQYSSNIIALSNFNKPQVKALDKALIKHTSKQSESTCQSNDSIDIQIYNSTNLQNTNLQESPEIEISDAPPQKIEIINSEKKSKLKQPKNYKTDFPPQILNLLAQVVKEFPENIIAKLTPAQKWNWCKTIKDLNEIDKYDLQTIYETIIYARNNDFWKANLLSVASLRDRKKNCELTKFDKINAQRISGNTSIIDNFTDEYLKNHSLKYKNNN
jgi:hypothetical protein